MFLTQKVRPFLCLDLVYWRPGSRRLEYWRSDSMESHFCWDEISTFLQNCTTTVSLFFSQLTHSLTSFRELCLGISSQTSFRNSEWTLVSPFAYFCFQCRSSTGARCSTFPENFPPPLSLRTLHSAWTPKLWFLLYYSWGIVLGQR